MMVPWFGIVIDAHAKPEDTVSYPKSFTNRGDLPFDEKEGRALVGSNY